MIVAVGNSISRLEGYTVAQLAAIRKELSYTPSKNFYGVNYARPLIDRKGFFPTGLLGRVKTLCNAKQWLLTVQDERRQPKRHITPFKLLLPHSPYPEQLEAAETLCVHSRGRIVAPTGFGKSILVALLIEKLNVPTLVVVPNLTLKEQLTASLKSYFPDLNVGGWGCLIAVENIDALENKKTNKNYDLMVLDEYHHSAAKTYRKVNKVIGASIYYKMGVTATNYRSQDEEDILLESVLEHTVYRVPHAHAVSRGLICPVQAYVHELPKTEYKSTTWRAFYSEAVVNNEYRNSLIASQLLACRDAGVSTLCLVKEIKHGQELSRLTSISFASGEDGNSKGLIAEFTAKQFPCLIGTTGVLGEGVDTKPAEFIIIAGLGKAKNSFLQWVGRGFRVYPGKDSCKVILFRDGNHKWSRDHYNQQKRILKEEFGIEVVKL